MTQTVCEIITVGNELLIGKTLNTNAHWLAKRITSLGGKVARIVVVGDDVNEIALSVDEAMQRKNRFIITVGGLGPTFDDKTLEGLAGALECELEINDEALKMIKEKYREYVEEGKMERAEMTPPRVKMAKLPKGARPLFNPVGTAPGVAIQRKGTTVVALPGVPSEMKAIFDNSVAPRLKQVAGDVTFFETSMEARKVIESEMAPLIDLVMHDNPYVYIKSHPKGAERISRIEFHFSATAKNSGIARRRVTKAFVQLSELIEGKGGKIRPIKIR
ncbi:MAG: nicotinamide mononucleotide deamidase-related protein [Candidatus Bathyarchaeota archaeon]|nr:nicotinamide mononucleotide deamidase-related protein [Candidatus Bathyarchaeota archaeon]